MHYAQLLTRIAAPAVAASVMVAAAPALAHREDPARGPSVQQRAEVRAYSQPQLDVRPYAVPQPRTDARMPVEPRAQIRTDTEPPQPEVRTYGESRTYSEPRPEVRTYSEPRPEVRTYSEPRPEVRTYSEPRPEVRTYIQPPPRAHLRTYNEPATRAQVRTYIQPPRAAARIENKPRRTEVRTYRAPLRARRPEYRTRFVGVRPRAFTQRRYTAPFVQYIRRSTIYRVAAHPRTRRVFVTRPEILVGRRYVQYPVPYRVNESVRTPAMYNANLHYYHPYPYSPQYYPQVGQWYSNYFGVPVIFVNGFYVPQYGYNGYGAPYNWGGYNSYNWGGYNQYNWGGYNPYNPGYGSYNGYPYSGYPYNPYGSYGANPYGYGDQTPYDNCMWNDPSEGGDGYCGADSGYGFASGYQLARVQGVVVAKSGSMLLLLGENGLSPIFVNEAPALQNGFAQAGSIGIGQIVDAYGFYNGNEFVATALV